MSMPPMPPKNPGSVLASLTGNHVAVRVPDLKTAESWYAEKMDFRVVTEWSFGDLQLAYLAPAADDGFLLEIIGGGEPVERAKYSDLEDSLRLAGYHHLCFMVDSVDDTIAELRRREVKVVAEPFELEAISRRLAFVADPWDNLIEFAQVLK